ncbi:unnamed protein product [Acanthoscelides obtectus]|uniref:Uncharacterized protein n=1 Tax=Acanthoscelides obtectus TaxID=200917 RepID=A0A9P0KSP1_ACAOB|nr:unnamed protein product [Acanthoscelides obtectus]
MQFWCFESSRISICDAIFTALHLRIFSQRNHQRAFQDFICFKRIIVRTKFIQHYGLHKIVSQ